MSTTSVEGRELAGRIEEIVNLACGGAEVILTDKHIPVAKLIPLLQSKVRVAGLHQGAMSMAEDFDKPLID